ncbi:MAG: IPTL-CTERM sorting domain-containing protein [Bacteroidota bacterium]|nr:IPTL-CTERM sorting domain-containing protein [Bacteroidota bacterium]
MKNVKPIRSLWIFTAVLCMFCAAFSTKTFAGVVFDGGPGTGAPPVIFNNFVMTKFEADPSPLFAQVTSVGSPARCRGDIGFSPALSHRRIGSGWQTWSHGYTGDVYFNPGLGPITITLPPGTQAFYFYAEPNNFTTFNVMATASDGTTSGIIPITGFAGAKFIGFYTNSVHCTLKSITITYEAGAAGLAIGEFGISCVSMIPTMGEWSLLILGLMLFCIAGVVMTRRKLMLEGGLQIETGSTFNLRNLPFEKPTFIHAFIISLLTTILGFSLMIVFQGYKLTGADIPGGLIAITLVAYLLQLIIVNTRKG